MKEKIIKLLKSQAFTDHLLAIELLKTDYSLVEEILPIQNKLNLSSVAFFRSIPSGNNGIYHFINRKYSILYGTTCIVRIPNEDIPYWTRGNSYTMNYSILDEIVS